MSNGRWPPTATALAGRSAPPSLPLRLIAKRTQHVDCSRIGRTRSGVGFRRGLPSGLAGARYRRSRASGRRSALTQRPATRFLRSSRCARPPRDRRKIACRRDPAARAAHARRATRRYRCHPASTISTLSSSIEWVEPTSNASNSRCTASKTTTEIRSGSISPSAVLEGRGPVRTADRMQRQRCGHR